MRVLIRRIVRRIIRAGQAFLAQIYRLVGRVEWYVAARKVRAWNVDKVNLCCGSQRVSGYLGVDYAVDAELVLDLSRIDLPFPENSLDTIVCMSAINYFTYQRGGQLVRQIYRALRPGGVCRVGVQDMKELAERYVRNNNDFYFQKLPDGRERFEGPTIGDKFAAWFYGYASGPNRCQYFYDFQSLAHLFKEAGFAIIERRAFLDSRLSEVELLDNRPDQMFFLEAVK